MQRGAFFTSLWNMADAIIVVFGLIDMLLVRAIMQKTLRPDIKVCMETLRISVRAREREMETYKNSELKKKTKLKKRVLGSARERYCIYIYRERERGMVLKLKPSLLKLHVIPVGERKPWGVDLVEQDKRMAW